MKKEEIHHTKEIQVEKRKTNEMDKDLVLLYLAYM